KLKLVIRSMSANSTFAIIPTPTPTSSAIDVIWKPCMPMVVGRCGIATDAIADSIPVAIGSPSVDDESEILSFGTFITRLLDGLTKSQTYSLFAKRHFVSLESQGCRWCCNQMRTAARWHTTWDWCWFSTKVIKSCPFASLSHRRIRGVCAMFVYQVRQESG